jgi:methanogenic corrinoid protein MtbC1
MADDDLELARLAVVAALRDGDAALAYRLVLRLMDEGYAFPTLIDDVLAPIQWDAGRRWHQGDASISEEHLATGVIETLVSMLGGMFDQPSDGDLVVVACAEGDTHSLPARMAAALLAYEGRRTTFLGTAVPASDLEGYLDGTEAVALVLSCTREVNLLGARASIQAAHGAGVRVLVGGRAFGGTDSKRWCRVGADARALRLSEVSELLDRWSPDPAAAEATAWPVPAVVDRLEEARLAMVAGLSAAIGGRAGGSGRLPAEVGELVDLLAVATYLDEPAMLADHARWLSALLVQRGAADLTASDLITSLAGEVPTELAEVAELVRRAEDSVR